MKQLPWFLVIVTVLVGIVVFVKPAKKAAPTPAVSPATKTFELKVEGRKLVSGPDSITVKQGDDVIIRITSDEDEELHLHGYDKMVDLTANQPAELHFTADLSGRFEYELEHSKTTLGELNVEPKP